MSSGARTCPGRGGKHRDGSARHSGRPVPQAHHPILASPASLSRGRFGAILPTRIGPAIPQGGQAVNDVTRDRPEPEPPDTPHLPEAMETMAPVEVRVEPDTLVRFALLPGCVPHLILDFGFATIATAGVEDVGDLIEGFQLRQEARVLCRRYRYSLDEDEAPDGTGDTPEGAPEGALEGGERRVVYRDKRGEVRIGRRHYDRVADALTAVLGDPRVQAGLTRAYARSVAEARAEAWRPGEGRAERDRTS